MVTALLSQGNCRENAGSLWCGEPPHIACVSCLAATFNSADNAASDGEGGGSNISKAIKFVNVDRFQVPSDTAA